MTTTAAINLLEKCETDLRALVATAADAGDYDAVLRITSWAKQISALTGASSPASSGSESGPLTTAAKKPRSARPAYPRFLKRGDQLVKIGWSKKDKSEYEHKAPFAAVLQVAREIAKAGKDGRLFQVSALDGSEVSGYQVYLIVAWWRSIGLLDQHGRQGYSIPSANQFAQAVESAWLELEEK